MKLEEAIRARMQTGLDSADADFHEADKCAINHFPGHESYAIENFLRCLCTLAFTIIEREYGMVPTEGQSAPEGT